MPDDVDKDYSERNDDVMNFQVRRLNVTLLFKLNILVSISHIQKQTNTHKNPQKTMKQYADWKTKIETKFYKQRNWSIEVKQPFICCFFSF